MTEPSNPSVAEPTEAGSAGALQPVAPQYPAAPTAHAATPHSGPVGKIRGTGVCILLAIVTLGIYPLIWFFQTHSEMKRHSGQGIDGVPRSEGRPPGSPSGHRISPEFA